VILGYFPSTSSAAKLVLVHSSTTAPSPFVFSADE
jgi:hypothetical protein